jgi:hypothetical protein
MFMVSSQAAADHRLWRRITIRPISRLRCSWIRGAWDFCWFGSVSQSEDVERKVQPSLQAQRGSGKVAWRCIGGDHSNDVVDFDRSLPHFAEWADETRRHIRMRYWVRMQACMHSRSCFRVSCSVYCSRCGIHSRFFFLIYQSHDSNSTIINEKEPEEPLRLTLVILCFKLKVVTENFTKKRKICISIFYTAMSEALHKAVWVLSYWFRFVHR